MNTKNIFTIEDIHKIRYENYEKTKNMQPIELINKTKNEAAVGWAKINALKKAIKA